MIASKTVASLRAYRLGRLSRIRQRRELDATSDRGLAELGIARGDIEVVAAGRFGRR